MTDLTILGLRLGGAVASDKRHWEDVNVPELRKIAAREFGIQGRGMRKKQLIHAMRAAYWERERRAAKKT